MLIKLLIILLLWISPCIIFADKDIIVKTKLKQHSEFKGADGTNYCNAFIKTKIIEKISIPEKVVIESYEDDDNITKEIEVITPSVKYNILDVPFIYYHTSIAYNGVLYYCNIPASLIGKEVIAYIHYAIKDEAKVKAYAGYLGNDWQEVQKNKFVPVNWNKKKSETLAKHIIVDEAETITNYDGEDKDEIGSIYPAADVVTQIYN